MYNYEITYFESKLNSETASLTKGFDVVCIFVNDKADANTLKDSRRKWSKSSSTKMCWL